MPRSDASGDNAAGGQSTGSRHFLAAVAELAGHRLNQRAWAFHDALAQGFAALMREQATMRGITTLVFSGGVIHNRLLRARLAHYLADFTLLFPQSLPAGDGGLSLGQGVIAAARWLAGEVQNG